MATNTKIRTEDVLEILDFKIKTSAAHAQLNVSDGETYDSVLSKIAERSPSLDEKAALDAGENPSSTNPFITLSDLNTTLEGVIPWKTIGAIGSDADFEGNDETPFLDAFATGHVWFYVKPATYTFTSTVTVPDNIRLVGSVTSSTILTSNLSTTLKLGDNNYISFMTVASTLVGATALDVSDTEDTEIRNCIVTSTATGTTVNVTNASKLCVSDTALMLGNLSGSNLTETNMSNLYVDALGTYGINLTLPSDLTMWGSVFYAGTPRFVSGTNIRIVGNHFNDGITNTTPISSVLLRANTPSTNNNEDESLTYLLQYLGSPPSTTTPFYSSNFTGPQSQDLTARASAIDLCLQWIYEERNFSLIAESDSFLVSWNPSTLTLTTNEDMLLVSAHRDAYWRLPPLSSVSIPNSYYIYYIIDRSLTTSDITLTYHVASLGSIPIDTTPPTGSTNNRQIYTLAYNLNGTLWWRGGGGSRFPATGGYTGEYFVDGKSKSFLDYVGASDYNQANPSYSNNFAGNDGESLTTRISKIDTLLQRLFEHSNLTYYLASDSYFSSDAIGELIFTGTLTFKLPHISGSITVSGDTWAIPDGSLLYFTWDQVTLGVATATVSPTVPLPDQYPLTTKYFVAAIRIGEMFYLWDGTRLPMTGGRWPLYSPSHSVVPIAPPTTLEHNIVWGKIGGVDHVLWEKLAVATSTGINLARNYLSDQTSASIGLTDLTDGEGLVVTHTWNEVGIPHYVNIQKVTLPLINSLEQNQFLWVQNRNGFLILGE